MATVKQTDVNTENKLLCLMLKSENAVDIVIEQNVTEDIFSYPLNKEIFNGIIEIYTDVESGGIVVGSETNILFEYIKSDERDKDKELLLQINKIGSVKADEKHLNFYIKTLRDLYKVKMVIQAIRNVQTYLKDNDNVSADELIDIYDESYQDVFENVLAEAKSSDTKDAVKQTVTEIIEDSTKETLVKFNLEGIDDYAKFEEGYLSYIVGDTGLGKTTLSANLVTACANNGLRILYINLETKTQDCIKKIISATCEVDGNRIKYARLINPTLLTNTDWDILEDIVVNDTLSEMGVFWIHDTQMSVEQLERHISREVRLHNIDVVIGDYYQLLTKEGYEDSPEGVVIPKVSKELMRIAGRRYMTADGKSKLLTHIWLAQSTKEIIYRQDKRPQKEDIYYGGQRDARLVLGIYRDEYYNEETRKPNVFEIGILKQNNGIANEWFDYMFEAQYQTIRDMTEEEKEILEENLNEDENEY